MTIDIYLLQHYTKKSAEAYRREIEIFISNNPNNLQYKYSDLIHWIGILREKFKNAKTINRILASIKAYYSYLCFIEIRKDNPTKSIYLKDKISRDIQLQDLFTSEELETLLTTKKERYNNLDYRNKVLISLLIYQALKPQEIERLEVTEINLEDGNMYIKSSPKSNNRTLNLKANQVLLFKKYIEEIRPKLAYLNPSKGGTCLVLGARGNSMTAEDITKHIKRNYSNLPSFGGAGGGRKVNCQSIRQSVITNLLKDKKDIRVVQVFAGHKYPSTTERYKQNNVDELKTALKIYHPIK
jgi:integrase/recombinase XerD